MTSTPERKKQALRGLKADVIAGYGGACECCGEDRIEFLAIDHAGGGGEGWRRSLGYRGLGNHGTFYRYLRRNHFPRTVAGIGLRVLCHNCNQSIGTYGYCPHQTDGAQFPTRGPFPQQLPMKEAR